ncbi:cation diffusion facilitator family transporter [Marinobacter nanhaiticus D15-8W]|uniref:Cation transporter n=1 Tax=Marinobacter nanhaiticus D15-8W TaxID=626887 RepID=N6WXF9_9GAMM|nr:cation diffusion facilitator family transporter [Marinobacter nanhaiticus]ENO16276.1 cation transporter [Marinobacter nanhaiticus D15-8W]BES72867.1 cation diffusion facilitator family transporter [Marinobacter nanhaiticus D15-8W]
MAGSSKKVIYAALAGNFMIACTKFVAAVITGSSAMFSEGIHSLVDTGNQVLLLYGMKRAARPADKRFPFGHGKEVYFWSFVVAILIFAVGSGVSIYEGVRHILHPTPIEDPTINYIVLGLGILFEGAAWFFAFTEFSRAKGKWGYIEAVQRGKDPTMFVVLFEDSAAMLGLLVAMGGIYLAHTTGMFWLDGLASVIIGLILGGTAIWLAYETKGLLIGEAANKTVIAGIRKIATETPQVDEVNELLTMHMGPDFILVNLSVKFTPQNSVAELERVIADLDHRIKASYPQAKRIFVEAESLKVHAAQGAHH